ncbi:LytTR family two component transcriptional regulator [Mucilaginibacter yixingensis]|uniref:LytTR family two component transcriptional regulator n=1 Tax=Mucilaginibacter yixingensis TaxID=1295612 RepID=A0A2T5JBQ6_9SPHI|nr:LytTR family DNA-binding domain-containing protein [Mucilaginibacter yixingensis]PTQ98209.1 LytTR family two component transcriptional regulator [Mucilaginibacter yixingensis]
MILRCIAIDDEPLALNLLKGFIERTPFLELEGSFLSAVDALNFVRRTPVDLIFSDIQLPDMDGIELARALEAESHISRVIFTTAYNQFALESYKVDALDYLLKPFDYDDFLKAAQKAERYQSLLNRAGGAEEEQYLFVRVEYQLVRVPLSDILFIEGLKDYAKISLKDTPKPLLTLMSLKALEEKLPAKRFMRVHRSFIASLDKISSVTRNTLHIGDRQVTIGEVYKEAFNQVTGKWLEKAD